MKFKLITLLALLCFSCAKPQQEQTVTFHAKYIECGSMTRAADHSEILSLIESTYTLFPFKLYTNESENQFIQMEFGHSYTVPVGTFRVTGQNSSLVTMTFQPSSKYRLGKSPWFYTDSNVTIEYGTSEYCLPVEVHSVGIVYDKSEVSKMQVMGQSGSYIDMGESDFVFSDHYGLFFINGSFSGTEKVHLKVIPKTGAQKETVFYFAAENNNEPANIYGKLEGGLYYILHPEAVTELGGISFTLGVPSWTCGME